MLSTFETYVEDTKKELASALGNQPEIEFPLHKAANDNNYDEVKRLLDSGYGANKENIMGYTALSYASAQGNIDIIQLLIANGADPSGRIHDTSETEHFFSSLHCAAIFGHIEATKTLLKLGASPYIVTADEHIPAVAVASGEHEKEIVTAIINAYGRYNSVYNGRRNLKAGNYTDLVYSIQYGKIETVKQLLVRTTGHNLNELLFEAVNAGEIQIARLLLHCKADPNSSSKEFDITSIFSLEFFQNSDNNEKINLMGELLVAYGADIHSKEIEDNSLEAVQSIEDYLRTKPIAALSENNNSNSSSNSSNTSSHFFSSTTGRKHLTNSLSTEQEELETKEQRNEEDRNSSSSEQSLSAYAEKNDSNSSNTSSPFFSSTTDRKHPRSPSTEQEEPKAKKQRKEEDEKFSSPSPNMN